KGEGRRNLKINIRNIPESFLFAHHDNPWIRRRPFSFPLTNLPNPTQPLHPCREVPLSILELPNSTVVYQTRGKLPIPQFPHQMRYQQLDLSTLTGRVYSSNTY